MAPGPLSGGVTKSRPADHGRIWRATTNDPHRPDRTRGELAGAPYGLRISGRVFDALDLSSVLMNQLWLERCSFIGADLRHATLDGCHLAGASIEDALFENVIGPPAN